MSEIVFEFGTNFVETLIMTDFITRYLGTKYRDFKKNIGFILCWIFGNVCYE